MTSSERTPSVSSAASAVAEYLREEQSGGRLLLLASVVALVWANVAGDTYDDFWGTHLDLAPSWLHLDLSLGHWAADGLLAIFFFVAGLEVKRELVVGELSEWRAAALPVLAAVGGMIVPALVAIVVSGGDALDGGAWAIPVATDIAFALGVLALVSSSLPPGVRLLLLSVAVVDDLLAITLIAILFTHGLQLGWVAGAAAIAALYALTFRFRLDRAWLLWLLAVAVWVCVHASGIHATVAGIVLAMLTPVRAREGETQSKGEHLEHRLHPLSAGFAVPVFALAAAGIPLSALSAAAGDRIDIAVFLGLVVGKLVGILGGARIAVALRIGRLPDQVAWWDVTAVALLGGVGYTVSLLISQLAFDDVGAQESAAAAVLAASVVASVLSVIVLRSRSRARA